ncbi:MAG: hypothetical protein KA477_00910 [Candidatus Levybacteria bacterium]|nr:hypothetical protein [Candidatus Levybacteria bacterium]
MNSSKLFNEYTFYESFITDLKKCKKEVIIESPFITTGRMNDFRAVFEKILDKDVKIYIFTRDPSEHEVAMAYQAETEIQYFEKIGVQALICTNNHHRKLAILDKKILWEGSLNILSQNKSKEIMRRIEDKEITMQMFEFLNLGKFL